MAIFSECLEDTEDKLWDIWDKKKWNHALAAHTVSCSPERSAVTVLIYAQAEEATRMYVH